MVTNGVFLRCVSLELRDLGQHTSIIVGFWSEFCESLFSMSDSWISFGKPLGGTWWVSGCVAVIINSRVLVYYECALERKVKRTKAFKKHVGIYGLRGNLPPPQSMSHLPRRCRIYIPHFLPLSTIDSASLFLKVFEPASFIMEITSPVIAKEPGDCCLTGTIHSGTPRGEIAKIAGIVTYLARPKEGSSNGNILLYFPDVWGLFNNGLLIMDAFADAGYFVLGLDYFRGVRSILTLNRFHFADVSI